MDLPALTRPENLAWLLLLPVLYWLARPQPPRRVVDTPHLAQWLRARERIGRRSARFRRWRFLLLVLAYGASVLAFCGPSHGGENGPRGLAVLLDTSASMGDVWPRARAAFAEQLRRLPPEVEVRLALCGQGIRLLPGIAAGAGVDRLLAQLPAAPTGAGGVDFAALAAQLESTAEQTAVWTITDGRGPVALPATGALTVLGESADNVGITALEFDDRWPLATVILSVEVSNFGAQPARLELGLAAEGEARIAGAAPPVLELAPGAAERVEVPLDRGAGGLVRLLLRADGGADGMPLDDVVALRLPPPPAPDIVVRADGESPPGLRAAAAALARETGGRVLVDGAEPSGAAFMLVDGGILPGGVQGLRCLTFGTRAGTEELAVEDLVFRPRIVDWDRADPITRGLDLSGLTVESCLRTDFLAGDGRVLIRGEHGPMLVVQEAAGAGGAGAAIHASFRLQDSNLALLPAFPQLLRRSVARAFGATAGPALEATNLLSRAESDLRRAGPPGAPQDRDLPPFGRSGSPLAGLLLLVALAAVALRVYVR